MLLQLFQVFFGLAQEREEFFFCLKLGGMHAPAAAAELHRMTQVQHLMVDEILEGEPRYLWAIKDTANHDRIVGRIVMAKTVAGMVAAPGQLRLRHQSVKKTPVELSENLL